MIYLDQLPPAQLSAVPVLLETMLSDPLVCTLAEAPYEDEETSDEEARTAARSSEWFKNNQGISFEDVVADLGFTMDQIRGVTKPA